MVGSGPFHGTSAVKGQFIGLKANKNYWGGPPKIDYLVYRMYNDEDAMIQALRKGEIDAVDEVSANDYNSLKRRAGDRRIEATGASFESSGSTRGAATWTSRSAMASRR